MQVSIRSLACPRSRERARLLAALKRIAYPVSASMEGILPQAPLRARNGQVCCSSCPPMPNLANERLAGRMKALGKLPGMEPVIEAKG